VADPVKSYRAVGCGVYLKGHFLDFQTSFKNSRSNERRARKAISPGIFHYGTAVPSQVELQRGGWLLPDI